MPKPNVCFIVTHLFIGMNGLIFANSETGPRLQMSECLERPLAGEWPGLPFKIK